MKVLGSNRTHCEKGHEFTPENTRFHFQKQYDGYRRVCVTCRALRWKNPLKPKSIPERFWEKVNRDTPSGCWEWLSVKAYFGYGKFHFDRKRKFVGAHRVAYELSKGPIPDGLVLDHLCRNPGCVNPDHLQVVSQRENCLRGISPTADNAKKTHCKRGHEFTPENTFAVQGRWRGCRQCRSAWRVINWAKRRDAGLIRRKVRVKTAQPLDLPMSGV